MPRFVPVVLVGAILVILVPLAFGVPFRQAFLRAMTLVVALNAMRLLAFRGEPG